MSMTINIGPKIAKVVQDLLDGGAASLDVDSVFAALNKAYGLEIFAWDRQFAEAAIRQKIKSHLKSAFSINGEDNGQLSFIKDDAQATIAVKQQGGSFVYVPIKMASIDDVDAATAAKVENIKNAQAALETWERKIRPLRPIMKHQGVSVGEAMRLYEQKFKAVLDEIDALVDEARETFGDEAATDLREKLETDRLKVA